MSLHGNITQAIYTREYTRVRRGRRLEFEMWTLGADES